jgi:hypothetical protein
MSKSALTNVKVYVLEIPMVPTKTTFLLVSLL